MVTKEDVEKAKARAEHAAADAYDAAWEDRYAAAKAEATAEAAAKAEATAEAAYAAADAYDAYDAAWEAAYAAAVRANAADAAAGAAWDRYKKLMRRRRLDLKLLMLNTKN